jgi:hypothetical protein
MKKKHAPAPVPQKAPNLPAKQAAPPQGAPAPKTGGDARQPAEAPAPTPGEQGTDLSEVPMAASDKKPDEKPSDSPAVAASDVEVGPPRAPQATVPTDPIDWFAMRRPFTNRGLSLTAADEAQIERNWTMTYKNLLGWGVPSDLSIKIANLGTPLAYDFALKRDNPTVLEKFDMETEKMLPRGKSLGKIVVPVLTPDTLSWSVEKLTGKKFDFRF